MIVGQYFDGRVSRRYQGSLSYEAGTVEISIDGDVDLPPPTVMGDLRISSRLDSVPRSLRFPDGQLFLTTENGTVDAWLAEAGFPPSITLAHRLESFAPFVAASLVGIVLCIAAFINWGVPGIADGLAELVPPEVEAELGHDVLVQLEQNGMLSPSELEQEEQVRLRSMLRDHLFDDAPQVTIHFYSFQFGPNALALPGGNIVMTDELVALAETDDELLSVFLHEVGHVKHRHLVRQTLRASVITVMIMWLSGDFSAASELAVTLPATLITMSYGRSFETDADQYAIEHLDRLGIGTESFAVIMQRLRDSQDVPSGWVPHYLSTHPDTDERIRMMQAD